MATVRHLGLFALPNIPLGKEADFLRGANRCVQPASEFATTDLNGVAQTIAPATLEQSTYTPVSFQRAMLWLWRVKQFSLSASIIVDDQNFDTEFEVQINSVQAPNKVSPLGALIENEKQKVCDVGMFYGSEQSDDFEDLNVGSWLVTVAIGDLQNMWANYPNTPVASFGGVGQRVRHDEATGLFYVPVRISLNIRGGDSTFSYTSGSSNTAATQATNLFWEISDMFGTVSRPFYYGSDNATGTITIEATEYWPYDPGDGLGPIYDSATGEQLRPFPN